MTARAILSLLCAVAIVGDIGCGPSGPKARALTIEVAPAEDLWSGVPPKYTPAALTTSGLLIFENNDDSDGTGGPDDTDSKVNGADDMRQMTTVIVHKLSSTPAAGDLLHVRKTSGGGNINVFRKGASPATSNRILPFTSDVTTDSEASQLITAAGAADVALLVEGVDPGNVNLCVDWSGTTACVTLHVRTGFTPRIFADTDRNAAVDTADAANKSTWSATSGAIVFVNNDRDCIAGRPDNNDAPLSPVIQCVPDEADVSELQVASAPLALAGSPGWSAVIRYPTAQRDDFRIFNGMVKDSTPPADTAQTVNATPMREIDISAMAAAIPMLRLGIEGREFDKPVSLDLCVMHTATRVDAACDRVALQTGRLLLQANDEMLKQVMVGVMSSACPTAGCPINNNRLRATLSSNLAAAELHAFASNDQWAQDETEICGQRAPRGTSQVSLHLPRRLVPCSPGELLCNFVHNTFPGVGTNQSDIDTHAAIVLGGSRNFGGNLEVSMFHGPTPGRIIVGSNMEASLVSFIEARAPLQAPAVKIDVGWLAVGHVDEVAAVVPASGGQSIVLADVSLGKALLTGGAAFGVPVVPEQAALFWHCRAPARDRLPSCFDQGTAAAATSGPTTFTSAAFSFAKPAGREWGFLRIYDGAGRGQVAQIGAVDAGNSRKVTIVRVWRLDTPDWVRCASTPIADMCDRPAANVGRAPADTLGAPAGGAPFWPASRFVRNTWFVPPAAGDKFVVVEDSLDWDPTIEGSAGKGALALGAASLVHGSPALITAGELRTAVADPTFWSKQEKIIEKLDGPPVAASMRSQLAAVPGGPAIIRLPMLYQSKSVGGSLVQGESLLPASVNLQVLRHSGGTLIIVPKPYGPSTGGADPYESSISTALAGLGTLRFVDDWEMYHIQFGEVHCGTNMSKIASRKWWAP